MDAGSPPRSRPRGSTLAEVMVSFLVLVPVIIVVTGLLPYSHAINRRAWALSAASNLARSQVERVRGMEFDSIPSSSDLTQELEGTSFRCHVAAAREGTASPPLLRRVTVTVQWTVTTSEELVMETLVARTAR